MAMFILSLGLTQLKFKIKHNNRNNKDVF